MGRGPRREAESGIHHVMNRGAGHQTIFFADADRREFIRLLGVIHEEYGVVTLAYCLMGNHYHLLLLVPEPGVLSEAMQYLSSVFTRHVNERIGRDGPLFRSRFHSIPVETDTYLWWATRYIHRNPLDLPGVETPRDHPWSSYPAYLGLCPCPDFLEPGLVMGLVGRSRAELVAVTEGDSADVVRPRAVGAAERLTIAAIERLIDCALAIEDITQPSTGIGRPRIGRTILVLLADRSPRPDVRRIVTESFAPRSPAAKAAALRRAEHRLQTDPVLRRLLRLVEDGLVHRHRGDAAA